MIQITAQMRVLVAIEPVDGRKGMDSLARLCQEKLAEDSFFRLCVPCFGVAAGRRSGCSAMTAKDTGWRKSVFPADDSCGGPEGSGPAPSHWKPMKCSC